MRKKLIVVFLICSLLFSFQIVGAQALKDSFKNGLQSLQYYTSSIDKLIPGLKPLETAINQFESSIEENIDVDESLLMIALIYEKLGNLNKSLDYLSLYLERNPEDRWVQVLNGDLWYQIGDEEKALAYYEQALEIGEYAKGYYGIGSIKASLGQEEEAIEAFANSVEIAPDFIEARMQLAILYYNNHQVEQALEHFEIAVLYDPWLAEAHYYLSVLYDQQGELEKAQHARDMAISYSEHYATLLQ